MDTWKKIVKQTVSGEWVFDIGYKEDGIFIFIPDQGGQMDSVPKIPEQMLWCEAHFDDVQGLKRVWTTTWKAESEEDVKAVEKIIDTIV